MGKETLKNITLADGTKCSAVDEYDTGSVRYILFEKAGGTRHMARLLMREDGDKLVYVGSCSCITDSALVALRRITGAAE